MNIRYFSEERNRRFVSRNLGPSFANIMDALTYNNNTSIEGDLNIDNVAAVQPIIKNENDETSTLFHNDVPMQFEQQSLQEQQQLPAKRKLDEEDESGGANPEGIMTMCDMPEGTTQSPQPDSNQVAELKEQLLQQQQSRISKKSKLLRRHSSNATPYNSSTFPPNKIVATNPPMLLSYRKKWIDITKHIQSNYKSLDKKDRKRVVHDLFSDEIQMGKIDIVKEGEGWSGGYNISGVRRGDIGNGVSQLLSQGFLRL